MPIVRIEWIGLYGQPMERVQVELYEHVPDFAVLRLPPCRFPGVLIQGDNLSNLCADKAALTRRA